MGMAWISLFCLQVSTSALNEAGCFGKRHNHTTMRVSREPGSQA